MMVYRTYTAKYTSSDEILKMAERALSDQLLIEYVMYMNRIQGKGSMCFDGIDFTKRISTNVGRGLIWC